MKPKQFLLALVFLIASFAAISFFEKKSALKAGCVLTENKLECNAKPATEAAGSSYIFFEAVSKYLVISLIK